jgi:NAD(P)H dehydrogenase (quinone)
VILVTGATGNVGYRLLENLDDAGVPATAMVRTEAKAVDLPPRVQHRVATLDGPPPPEVLQEFDNVFLLSPDVEAQAEMEVLFVDALVAAGHRPRVLKVAYDGFQDLDCDVRFMLPPIMYAVPAAGGSPRRAQPRIRLGLQCGRSGVPTAGRLDR